MGPTTRFHLALMAEWRLGLPSKYLHKAFHVFTFVLGFNLLFLKAYFCFSPFITLTLRIVLVSALNSVCLCALLSFKMLGINSCHYSGPCFVMFGDLCAWISLQNVWYIIWIYLNLSEFICKMCGIFLVFLSNVIEY